MAEPQTRDTLRKLFAAGQLPTQEHFGDLIESMLNMRDEGFRKSPDNGMEVSAMADKPALMSFYRDRDPAHALWSVRYGGESNALQFVGGPAQQPEAGAVLSLLPAQADPITGTGTAAAGTEGALRQPVGGVPPRVGINTVRPQQTLDVAGVIASQGRVGSYARHVTRQLPANGEPQTLIDHLTGCHAFEVMAGVGAEGTGRYALLHAIALNTFNPVLQWWQRLLPGSQRRGIRATSAHYGRRCDRLSLWWEGGHGKGSEYKLRIRTRCDYGPTVVMNCSVTQLWFDQTMADSRRPLA
jgi:hypothetical protein